MPKTDINGEASLEKQFIAAERDVERHSADLKKELRLFDLIWIQILSIVGLGWVGTAAKLGSSHVMFWIPAVLLFYIPSGIVVVHLAKEMPLEGGIYQWAKLRFGPFVGFQVAWNYWMYQVLLMSRIGIQTADNIAYALGSKGAWIASNRPLILAFSFLIVCGLMLVAWRGLSLGKWISNFGGLGILFLFLAMIAVAIPRWLHGTVAIAPVAFTFPALTLFNLNILGKMGFGALSGFDGVAIFAGEFRDRNVISSIRRSVWLAAPIISAMFILGTAAVLVFVQPDAVDLVSPMTQVLSRGAALLVTPAAVILVTILLAQTSLGFNLTIRLPMVAGWDHLLPSWVSRLHPRYRTPGGSVLALGAMSYAFAVVANFGTGNQEAFQLLDNAGGISFALVYLVMFAIPLVARGEKPSLGIRLASVSGFLMTLLYVVLSVFPIIEVENAGTFVLKMIAAVVGLQLVTAVYYWYVRRSGAV